MNLIKKKKKLGSIEFEVMDRISELPEPILHRILSFLSHKQAIQTSALSRAWRDVGPTGPKIELRESWFKKSGKRMFLSVLGNTLQRYDHRNLSALEFILEMSRSNGCNDEVIDSESASVLDELIPMLLTNMMHLQKFDFAVPNYLLAPSLVFRAEFLTQLCLRDCKFINDHHKIKPLFKGLKRLSLQNVRITNKTLDKILRTCPLIEYLSLSGRVRIPLTLDVTSLQAELLSELHLSGPNLKVTTSTSTDDLLLIKRLHTLSLFGVDIREATLEKIMRSCPMIQHVHLPSCVEFRNNQLNSYKNNSNSKHFTGYFTRVNNQTFETIEIIRIKSCPDSCGHDKVFFKYFFPRLKSLCLCRVRLSAELLESFSSNFPSLEELELRHCCERLEKL